MNITGEISDKVMQRRIKMLNEDLLTIDIEKIPIGLFDGKMGLCIYFYYQSRYYQEKRYHKFAERLLNLVAINISDDMEIDFQKGLTGVCFGINYLIENNFIKGNANTILKDPEEKIYRDTCAQFLSDSRMLSGDEIRIIVFVSLYFCKRLQDANLLNNERFIYQDFVINCINRIEAIPFTEKYSESFIFLPAGYFLPLYLTLLSKAYNLGFYNYKIKKIWDEMHEMLLTTYPYLQSNRFFLGLSMKLANQYHMDATWERHIKLLLNQSNVNRTIESEFRNKNILPNNGLSGLYYIFKQYGYLTDSDKKQFFQKITQSVLWDNMPDEKYHYSSLYTSLAYGLVGVALAYQDYSRNSNIANQNHRE